MRGCAWLRHTASGPAPKGRKKRQRLISARINTKTVVAAESWRPQRDWPLSLWLVSWPAAFAVGPAQRAIAAN